MAAIHNAQNPIDQEFNNAVEEMHNLARVSITRVANAFMAKVDSIDGGNPALHLRVTMLERSSRDHGTLLERITERLDTISRQLGDFRTDIRNELAANQNELIANQNALIARFDARFDGVDRRLGEVERQLNAEAFKQNALSYNSVVRETNKRTIAGLDSPVAPLMSIHTGLIIDEFPATAGELLQLPLQQQRVLLHEVHVTPNRRDVHLRDVVGLPNHVILGL